MKQESNNGISEGVTVIVCRAGTRSDYVEVRRKERRAVGGRLCNIPKGERGASEEEEEGGSPGPACGSQIGLVAQPGRGVFNNSICIRSIRGT